MKPVVDRLQQQYAGRIDFLVYPTLESDVKASEFAGQQGVRGVPTAVLVTPDGTERRRWVGAQQESELVAEFESALADGQ